MAFDENTYQNENHTAIERVIEELNTTNLTFDNYKRFGDKVDSNNNIIIAQIENGRSRFEEVYADFSLATKTDDFKRVSMDGLVPKDVFKMVISMNKILKDTISWEVMKSSMYEIMYKKNYSIIDEANALTIKKEALQEMREMEKERNKVITDAVTHKFTMIDERFDSMIKTMQESQLNERREMLATFERMILSMKINKSPEIKTEQPIIQTIIPQQPKPIPKPDPKPEVVQTKKPQTDEEYNNSVMKQDTPEVPIKPEKPKQKSNTGVDDIEDDYKKNYAFDNEVL